MNQTLLLNDDWFLNKAHGAWCCSAIASGQNITIYFHSLSLSQLAEIDNCTKFDLEEVAELWFERNEPEGDEVHIQINT